MWTLVNQRNHMDYHQSLISNLYPHSRDGLRVWCNVNSWQKVTFWDYAIEYDYCAAREAQSDHEQAREVLSEENNVQPVVCLSTCFGDSLTIIRNAQLLSVEIYMDNSTIWWNFSELVDQIQTRIIFSWVCKAHFDLIVADKMQVITWIEDTTQSKQSHFL